jgi:transcriptional regulator with XRE-family HTH domain
MSQVELARRIGVSKTTMNAIEHGQTLDPGVSRIIAIADVLHLSLDALVGRAAYVPRRREMSADDDPETADAAYCPECGVGDACHLLTCQTAATERRRLDMAERRRRMQARKAARVTPSKGE